MKKHVNLEINQKNISSKSILNALNLLDKKEVQYTIEKDKKSKSEKPLIVIRNLSKDFGSGERKKTVLKNISFAINENENVALMGGNGAGKTTLVEIIGGLNKQTGGTIEYLFEYEKSWQDKIGIQFQDSSYPPALTVKEIIKFIIKIYKPKLNQDEINALIRIFGIDEYYTKVAHKLSGGQQQRLNVLLALMHKPKVVFLDELSTGLDVAIKTRIKNFIEEFSIENGITIVIVSHDTSEIKQLCEKIIFLKDGEIVINDTTKNIIKKYGSIEELVFAMLY